MGMATSTYYGNDPGWVSGPKYNIIIILSKQDLNYPFMQDSMMVGCAWNFIETDQYKWLENNCSDKYNWAYGKVLEDDSIVVLIEFLRKEHVNAFCSKFEICEWNFELEATIKKWPHEFICFFAEWSYYSDKHDEEYYQRVQWCRENINYDWTFQYDDGKSMNFYFENDDDAMAFKLRWI